MKSFQQDRPLHVLYVSDGGRRVRALTEVLLNRGHLVNSVRSLREILIASEPHVLVLDLVGRSESESLEMLEELQNAGCELPIVMVSGQPSFGLCQGASELGVAELIQDGFAPNELVRAVERCATDQGPLAPALFGHSECYTDASEDTEEALERLADYLTGAQLAPVHIARILVASAELIDNVRLHAYPGEGDFHIQAALQRSRLLLCISDEGCGMNPSAASLEAMAPALPARPKPRAIAKGAPVVFGGLSRASRLADHFETNSDPSGTSVMLEFELSPTACASHLLPNLEQLGSEPMRSLLRGVESGATSLEELSPVLSLTIQRLLGREAVQRFTLKRV